MDHNTFWKLTKHSESSNRWWEEYDGGDSQYFHKVMKRLSIYLKYAVLVIIVLCANFFLFTYNHQNGLGQNIYKRRILENLDNWRNLSGAEGKLEEIEMIRNTCDDQMLKRDSSNLDVLFIAKDKRFNQKLEQKNFLIDEKRKSIFYFNKHVDINIWSQILIGIQNQTNSTSGLKTLTPKDIKKFNEAAEKFDKILLGLIYKIVGVFNFQPTSNVLNLSTFNSR